jgi:hypothetical protein
MSPPIALSQLPGIPRTVVRRLRRLTIESSADLLRIDVFKIAGKLRDTATAADLLKWRAVASLLEVDGMAVDVAVALQAGGISGADELGSHKISDLRKLLAAARTAGTIAAAPDDDALAKWMVDSARLAASGVLNVTVVAKTGGKPLHAATATAGRVTGTTDANGRVRLLRLPTGTPLMLAVEHRGSAPKSTEVTPQSTRILVGTRIELAKSGAAQHHGAAKSKKKSKRHLSEFAGDVLPERTGQPLHTETEKGSRLREGDHLRWFETLKGGDAKLVTRFCEYDGTRWFTRVWRVPKAKLPAAAKEGDSFRVAHGALVPSSDSAMAIARARVARRVMKGVHLKRGAAGFKQFTGLFKKYLHQTKSLRGA